MKRYILQINIFGRTYYIGKRSITTSVDEAEKWDYPPTDDRLAMDRCFPDCQTQIVAI